MNKLPYWERRQVQNMYEYMESAEEAASKISQVYLKSSRYISLQASDIFDKYMTKHNLSEADARRMINTMQDKASLDELLRKLSEGEGGKKELKAKLESSAYQARLERLKQLQNQLDLMLAVVYEQEKQISTAHYVDLANEAYYRTIYDMQQRSQAAFSFGHISADAVDKQLRSKWSGKNYSNRIWGNTKALAQDLKEELLINLVTGRTDREVADIIANKFGQSSHKARRLVRTESAFLSAELNFKAYEEMGIEKYKFLATLDLKTSIICRSLDGEIFSVKDRQIGVNCNPMHPFCRSTTIAMVSESTLENLKRSAVDPATGERITVPADMNYKEWYKKYVKGKAEAEEKKVKNRNSDKKQHEKYKNILGDNVPETLDDFQDMKYNDIERWVDIKEAYKDVNWQRKALNNHSSGEVHSVPSQAEANSVFDKYENGKLVQRRYYGKTGKPRLDIDMTDHHNSKVHPIVPHRHGWKELENNGIKREDVHDIPLRLGDKIANADILKGGT